MNDSVHNENKIKSSEPSLTASQKSSIRSAAYAQKNKFCQTTNEPAVAPLLSSLFDGILEYRLMGKPDANILQEIERRELQIAALSKSEWTAKAAIDRIKTFIDSEVGKALGGRGPK